MRQGVNPSIPSPKRMKITQPYQSVAIPPEKATLAPQQIECHCLQACPEGLRHGFGIAAIAASVPLQMTAAALGHANLQATAIYTTAAGLEARDSLARMWDPYAIWPQPVPEPRETHERRGS